MAKQRSIIDDIPHSLLIEYQDHKLSSRALGELTGFHAAAIRRALPRKPKLPQAKNKTALIEARKAFRKTLAHLAPKEIKILAHVSLTTANRIRKLRHQDV